MTYQLNFTDLIEAYNTSPEPSFKVSNYFHMKIVNLKLNMPSKTASDFRYAGKNNAIANWPNPFYTEQIMIKGGR